MLKNNMEKLNILIIGSGPIRIGQAAEFDYSGSQACRAVKEEGHRVILLNSNPATIQTDVSVADVVYIRPITAEVVEEILKAHRPDGVIATLGGQVALNLLVELDEKGVWDKYGVSILGTSADSVRKAEGRNAFRDLMRSIGEPVVDSAYVSNPEEALDFAKEEHFPFIVRPDFTLGGTGGGVAFDAQQLARITEEGLRASPVHRVLVERYLKNWREIELEVVRDNAGNKLCVCGMENVDPMGVHTGDSIVVAPVLTLPDAFWQRLRSSAFRIVDAIGIKGACNVQFAVSPSLDEYVVIEVNPRASRSSALASKATGYPIARVAAKIAMGINLTDIPNPVTGVGSALAEPALDYVVVKFPRWPFEKFPEAEPTVGTRMKSTGEVMAIGGNYIEALLKAIRSLDLPYGLDNPEVSSMSDDELLRELVNPTYRRMWATFELLKRGYTGETISEKSGIHKFFIDQAKVIVDICKKLSSEGPGPVTLSKARRLGFSQEDISRYCGLSIEDLEKLEGWSSVAKAYREVDSTAGEVPSASGYWYSTCSGSSDELKEHCKGKTIAVLGSGPIRIGQGVEFDYCCVKAIEAIRKLGYRAVMINNNPETVSTDHDMSDALYFEPLTVEDVMPILEREGALGVFACFGGQTALKLGLGLEKKGIKLLGMPASAVETAEDRGSFSELLTNLNISQPKGIAVSSVEEALSWVKENGFPVMVRPSFVIGGLAMQVVYNEEELSEVLERIIGPNEGAKVLVDQFLPGKEFEVDALCDGDEVFIPGIFEHLDPAGVHSGDSISIFPDISLSYRQREKIKDITTRLAKALGVKGLINIQFVISGGETYVIEANPRSSRTVPIAAKLSGVPLVEIAVAIAMGKKLKDFGLKKEEGAPTGPFGVKVPVFSTEKLPGVDNRLGPAMQSTGESLGVADTIAEALKEGFEGAGWKIPQKGKILFTVSDEYKSQVAPIAGTFKALGWEIYATEGTGRVLEKWGIHCKREPKGDELIKDIKKHKWDVIFNVPSGNSRSLGDGFQIRRAAIELGVPCVNSIEVLQALAISLAARS